MTKVIPFLNSFKFILFLLGSELAGIDFMT